jgi:hypothetical protein
MKSQHLIKKLNKYVVYVENINQGWNICNSVYGYDQENAFRNYVRDDSFFRLRGFLTRTIFKDENTFLLIESYERGRNNQPGNYTHRYRLDPI